MEQIGLSLTRLKIKALFITNYPSGKTSRCIAQLHELKMGSWAQLGTLALGWITVGKDACPAGDNLYLSIVDRSAVSQLPLQLLLITTSPLIVRTSGHGWCSSNYDFYS